MITCCMVPSKSAGAASAAAATDSRAAAASTALPPIGAAASAALSAAPPHPANRPVAISAGSSAVLRKVVTGVRSEEHTSELQSLMRISYAVFWLKKKHLQYARKK